MAMTVRYNAGAGLALGKLNKNNSKSGKALSKVSSGMKITSAQDDASAYAISERMRVRIRALDQAHQNVQNGSALLKVGGGGISNIVDELRSLKELAINAANDTNTDEDRATIQKEFIQRMDTINDIATTTAYNGKRLLDGTWAKKTSSTEETSEAFTGEPILIYGDYTITDDGYYSLADGCTGTITVNAKNVRLTQQTPATQLNNVSIVTSADGNTNLQIKDLNIANTEDKNIIKFQGEGNRLTVRGTNTLLEKAYRANSAAVNVGDGLTIVGSGSLEATSHNGAAIGSDYMATAGYIKIGGSVKITATSGEGAAIGSGYSGNVQGISHVKDIVIAGNAKVTATSEEGAGIGSGCHSTMRGDIVIAGNAKVTATTTNSGAGIGSGYSSANARDILIGGNATVTATGTGGAGIGSGTFGSGVENISIGGKANVTAKSTYGGAGIGSGDGYDSNRSSRSASSAGDITISRSATVNAASTLADDIGKGRDSTVGTVSIGQTTFDIDLDAYIDSQDDLDAEDTVTTENLGTPLRIHGGDSANQNMNIFIEDMHTKSLGAGKIFDDDGNFITGSDLNRYNALNYDPVKQAEWLATLRTAENKTLDDISVTTRENANLAIRVLDGALEYALDQATTVGAYLQRLDYTADNVTTMSENVQASESTIRDADMAKEMTEYTKYNVLAQAAQAMLAQANQNSSAVLSLLQ